MRIETGTKLEIVHKNYGKFNASASKPFNTKDLNWPLILDQEKLVTNKRTYLRNADIKCLKKDVVSYFLV